MFCCETLGSGIHVDVTLTCTTYVNIVAEQVHRFMALTSSSRIMHQTEKNVEQWFEEHDRVAQINSPDLNQIKHLKNVLEHHLSKKRPVELLVTFLTNPAFPGTSYNSSHSYHFYIKSQYTRSVLINKNVSISC